MIFYIIKSFNFKKMALKEKSKSNKKRSIIYIIILTLGVFAVFLFFGKKIFKKEEAPLAEIKKEDTFILKQTTVSEELEFFGNLEAEKQSDLAAKTSGRISNINVDEGDQVKKGQLLANLYPDQNAIDLANKSRDLQNFEKYRIDQDRFLDRQVKIAREELDVAKEEEDYARENDPARLGVAEKEVDRAEAELRSAKKDRDAQKKNLSEQSGNLVGSRNISGQNVTDTRIVAPFDGVVTEKFLEEGEVVNMGDSVVSVADVSSYKVTIEVPDIFVDQLRTGLQARVILDGISGEHGAVITTINPSVDSIAKKIKVEVTLDSVPQNAKVDMFARVFIKFPPRTAYFVPNNFILSGYQGSFVMLENKKEQLIKRGMEREGMTEIKFDGISDNITILRN